MSANGRKAKFWFTGYNSNVRGHEGKIRYFVYNGGTLKTRRNHRPHRRQGLRGNYIF